MSTLNNQNLSKLNGKTLYQIDIINRETGFYLAPIYISAYTADEASEKAHELEGSQFRVKGISSDWLDEKITDEEKLESAVPHPPTRYKFKDGIGEVRNEYIEWDKKYNDNAFG